MECPGFPDHRHKLEREVTSVKCSFSTRDHPSAPRQALVETTTCFHSPASEGSILQPPSSTWLPLHPEKGRVTPSPGPYNKNRMGKKATGGQGQVRVGVKKDAGARVGLHRTHSFEINLSAASGEGPSTPPFICSFTTKVALTCIF